MPIAKHAPWALLPCILLALSSVTLLAPPRAARADAPHPAAASHPAASHPATVAYDDGDGDELLEHWGDPQFSREARLQMAAMALLSVPVVILSWRGRAAKQRKAV